MIASRVACWTPSSWRASISVTNYSARGYTQAFIQGTSSRLLEYKCIQVTNRWIKLLRISDEVAFFQRLRFVHRLLDVGSFDISVFGHHFLLGRSAMELKRFMFKCKCEGLDSVRWLEPAGFLAEISRVSEGEKTQKQDAASAIIEKFSAAAAVKC